MRLPLTPQNKVHTGHGKRRKWIWYSVEKRVITDKHKPAVMLCLMFLTIASDFLFFTFHLDPVGLNTSERYAPGASTSGTTTYPRYNEETSTTVPYVPENDYLLTENPLKYSVLFSFRQQLDNSRFHINVNAVEGTLAETLYVITVHNRTVLFHGNNSTFGLFKLANVSSWQRLLVSFNHREISITQECEEFNFLSLPSTSKLERWEEISITVHTENFYGQLEVCKVLNNV